LSSSGFFNEETVCGRQVANFLCIVVCEHYLASRRFEQIEKRIVIDCAVKIQAFSRRFPPAVSVGSTKHAADLSRRYFGITSKASLWKIQFPYYRRRAGLDRQERVLPLRWQRAISFHSEADFH